MRGRDTAGMSLEELRAEMCGHLKGKPEQAWRWLRSVNGWMIHKPKFFADGTATAFRAVPERELVEALVLANRRLNERRSASAKKAAQTRALRRERDVADIAKQWAAGKRIGPRTHCDICGKGLTDPKAIERGIGPECWQDVLRELMAQAAGGAA